MTEQNFRTPCASVTLLQDFLFKAYEESPDKVAIICQDQQFTYQYVQERSNALAHWLRSRGVRRHDRVMIIGERSAEVVLAFWATLIAEGVVVLLSTTTKESRLLEVFHDCRPSVVIADVRQRSLLHNHRAIFEHSSTPILYFPQSASRFGTGESEWDSVMTTKLVPQLNRSAIDSDLAALIYTSGSTGEAKGVMLTHRNMVAAAQSVASYLGMIRTDVILLALPIAFDYGLYQIILCILVGATLVIAPEGCLVTDLLALISKERVTGWPGLPSQFAQIRVRDDLDEIRYPTLRFLTSTASTLSLSTISSLRKSFPKCQLFSMYGLTECHRCSYLPPVDIDRKPGSVGIAIPNTEFWLVAEDGSECRSSGEGELVIRGSTVMAGYWGKPQQSASCLRPGLFGTERVLYTGDWCRLDDEGYLYFLGRLDDVFKCGGVKVVPLEIEKVILSIPSVIEAAIVPVPDQILGEIAKAFVVTAIGANLSPDDVRRECRRYLNSSSVPQVVVFLEQLPKNTNGKVDKTALIRRDNKE